MDKAPKYSVIIPVYNAENTLKRCVDSLLRQNYMDVEIILVNDGSTDGSGLLCKVFSESSQQIVYINKGNGGVSSARNAGLEVAAGKYIVFVDSDDSVEEDYFKRLDMLDSKEECDFIWFSYKKVGNGKEFVRKFKPHFVGNIMECTPVFCKALCRKTINSLWNKRYTNCIIQKNSLRFPVELSVGEDKVFNLQYAMQCKSCRISDTFLYTLNIENQQSLTRKVRTDLPMQFQLLDEELLRVIKTAQVGETDRERYLEAFNFTKLRSVYSEAKRMHITERDFRLRWERIQQMCDEINRKNDKLPKDMFSQLLRIPVRLKMTAIIDLLGYILARYRNV